MPIPKPLSLEEKLAALRQEDQSHPWHSLDDRVSCILCERTFSGRQVDVSLTANGRVRLRCPSEGCCGTSNVWVLPGNPLVSARAWQDWQRVLSGKKTNHKQSAARASAGAATL